MNISWKFLVFVFNSKIDPFFCPLFLVSFYSMIHDPYHGSFHFHSTLWLCCRFFSFVVVVVVYLSNFFVLFVCLSLVIAYILVADIFSFFWLVILLLLLFIYLSLLLYKNNHFIIIFIGLNNNFFYRFCSLIVMVNVDRIRLDFFESFKDDYFVWKFYFFSKSFLKFPDKKWLFFEGKIFQKVFFARNISLWLVTFFSIIIMMMMMIQSNDHIPLLIGWLIGWLVWWYIQKKLVSLFFLFLLFLSYNVNHFFWGILNPNFISFSFYMNINDDYH
mgnify:CR=1 FL=1